MELRNVRTFVSVAGLSSFRRAAEVLHYAPSTVSAQVQSLEEELRVKLFDRLEKGIRLTEAGARFLPYALKLLDMARESISAAAGEHAQGMLAVRLPETLAAYRFPALLPLFRREHPAMGLRLRGSSAHDVQRYLEKGLDLAFVVGEAGPAENCFIETIGNERIVLAGSAAEWGTGCPPVSASDLAGRPMLAASSDSSGRVALECLLGREGVHGHVWIDFSSLAALKHTLLATPPACGLAPRVALEKELASGVLVELGLPGLPMDLPVNMLWHREKWISSPLAFLMDLFRQAWMEAVPPGERPPGGG